MNQEQGSSRRGSARSVLSSEGRALIEGSSTILDRLLLEALFAKKGFLNDPSVSQYLVERAQQQPLFKQELLTIIEQSKTEKAARIQTQSNRHLSRHPAPTVDFSQCCNAQNRELRYRPSRHHQ